MRLKYLKPRIIILSILLSGCVTSSKQNDSEITEDPVIIKKCFAIHCELKSIDKKIAEKLEQRKHTIKRINLDCSEGNCSLEGAEYLYWLCELEISGNLPESEYKNLGKLRSLRKLYISGLKNSVLRYMYDFHYMSKLTIRESMVNSSDFISRMPKLRRLYWNRNKGSIDLNFLKYTKNIRVLWLKNHNTITSSSELKNLKQLQSINFSNSKIDSPSFENLPSLHVVNILNTGIKDFSFLNKVPSLYSLEFSPSCNFDINVLYKIKLKELASGKCILEKLSNKYIRNLDRFQIIDDFSDEFLLEYKSKYPRTEISGKL
ncbi:MAG: hypothetical protein JXR95_12355 [Deltaproteobacteria bacterium]|nr:hypothetical protein [Deltaproteobacteria bacterium]